ncbi:hypothetical protein AMK31_17740 [Streptomyces sp. TSRI0107]|nr:hypothetical protein AMK31_17740 [Streptomyces sp. TSRI0107]
MSTPDAERLGLVNRVVPDAEPAQTAREWAGRLAAGPTRALALTNTGTADAREGLAVFGERRDAAFRGR